MVQLVIVYCLIANAQTCVERRPTFERPLTQIACMMTAQEVGEQYVNTHPEWRLAGWRCEINLPVQKRA